VTLFYTISRRLPRGCSQHPLVSRCHRVLAATSGRLIRAAQRPSGAVALIRFATDPAMVAADVSPMRSMTLSAVMQLVARPGEHF
jgi:hypothetical protein